MNTENVKKFYEALKADKAMAEEFQTAGKNAAPKNEVSAAALVVDFAAKKSFSFSAAELKAFENEMRELSAEELDNVNAAINNRVGVCFVIGTRSNNGHYETAYGLCLFGGFGRKAE